MIRSSKFILSLSCMLLAVLAAACGSAPAPAPTAVPSTPTPLQLPVVSQATSAQPTIAPTSPPASTGGEVTGAALFELSCSACHGADRAGTTFDMDGQKISVPALGWDDLNSMYSTDASRGTPEQQLALAITKGLDETGGDMNTMMPHWSSLSQAQVDSLVKFLQTSDTAAGSAASSPAAMNLQGQQLYEAACAACHGADGAGQTFEDEGNKIETPSLHWSELSQTYSADASRGTVEQQVALGITKGQDETGGDLNAMMPRWSFLSQAQVDSLVNYLKTAFP